jgi:hypothetical protein
MQSFLTHSWLRAAKSWLALLSACFSLASCANLIGPHEIDLPLARLQQSLDRRFPMEQRMLEIMNVRLSQPQLALLSDSGRIALTLNAAVSSPLLRREQTGVLGFSGRLFLDTQRNAIFMRDARIDRLEIDGMDDMRQRQLQAVASAAADLIMRDMPLYSFRPEDLHYAGMQFLPTKITTLPNALAVTIEPAK